MNRKQKTKNIIIIVAFLLIISLIVNPTASVTSASRGIRLWFDTVFPALFPFFVSVELLNKSGFVKILGIIMEPIVRPLFNIPGCGAFTFVIGITSGYPMGAKVTSEMRKEHFITRTEGERMLAYCNNSGPLFILGAVGVGMFKIPALGNLLLLTHILACITVAFLFRFYKSSETDIVRKEKPDSLYSRLNRVWSEPLEYNDIGSLLGNAIKNSLNTILAIGGFIIFFSVIIAVLQNSIIPALSLIIFSLSGGIFDINIINAVLCGFFEITTGSSIAAQANNCSIITRASAVALIIGWAGLSVHAQVLSIISETDISPKLYFIGKSLQSILACIYTYLILIFKADIISNSKAVTFITGKDTDFLNGLYYGNLLSEYYRYSLLLLALCFILVSIKYGLCKIKSKRLF